ncbi:hypothetical protein Dthio_PD2661 [Desulfonatronospira thiodismutans ASO3-1]|uniref:Uncharacterized protein n=1 Tax=Desulfonatronospira thiodismutans ASO3-1 TaxID=555779 RepID=D6SKN9_9BACT|nr:hypothetical protein [Desulfonatronospira thiodismutans]EFI35250.1 hypothetical protein Dthio_PD2661 [Desulfonatronospira thiodismutans ASO3-1]
MHKVITGKHRAEANPAVRHDFYLQWQGRTLCFNKDSMAVTSSEISQSSSFCFVFVDFPQDEGPEQVYVQGDAKFAPILARRQAEQKGELGSDSVYHVYKVEKTGKNESEIVYHIIPRTLLEKAKSECYIPAGCVLMDWTGLLLSLLKKGGRKDQAIALHAESSILVVAGNSSRVKLVRRYPLFSGKKGGLGNVPGMIEHDLELCRREKGADFSEVQWIEICRASRQEELPRLGLPVRPWPLARYTHGKTSLWSALPFLLDAVEPSLALYGEKERYVRPLQVVEKWAWLILIAGAAALGYIGWMNHSVADRLNDRTATLEKDVDILENKVQSYVYHVKGTDEVDGAFELAGDLSRALAAPSPVQIWNSFFGSWPDDWQLIDILFSYDDGAIRIQAEGLVSSNPGQSARQSSRFRQQLTGYGFEIEQVDMDLKSKEARFVITASYPWS